MAWTHARKMQLKSLWTEGLPASKIAKELGITRNAVIGKAHYLDLPRRDDPSLPRTKKPPRATVKIDRSKSTYPV
ncbi:MAG: GcrA family cell cycle regulator [bacterium]